MIMCIILLNKNKILTQWFDDGILITIILSKDN